MLKKITKKQLAFAIVATTCFGGVVWAGTGGSAEFGTVYTMLNGWFTGTLGKIIALTSMGVGLAWGVVKQSIMAVVTGIGTAMSVFYGPAVVDSMVTAALPLIS